MSRPTGIALNINDHVIVRLTEHGRAGMIASGWEVVEKVPPAGEPYRVQLWVLMTGIGGPGSGMGSPQLIVDNRIEIEAERDSAEKDAMPEPWPGMVAEYHEPGIGWRRQAIDSVSLSPSWKFRREDGSEVTAETFFYCSGGVSIPWTPEFVREVRSADGRILWRRP